MRYYRIILILMITFFSCSSNRLEEILISRFRTYNNSDTRIQEIYMKGDVTIWEKNYSSNGWQVFDSIAYKENVKVVYQPQYGEARDILKYSIREGNDKIISESNENVRYPLKDKYELGNFYLKDIKSIYESMGIKTFETKSENILKVNFIPTILTRYGIPFNELLDSCKYSITNGGLLKNDNFYFENFTVNRDFEYDGLVLKTVNIVRVDKVNNQTERITEKFEIEKIK